MQSHLFSNLLSISNQAYFVWMLLFGKSSIGSLVKLVWIPLDTVTFKSRLLYFRFPLKVVLLEFLSRDPPVPDLVKGVLWFWDDCWAWVLLLVLLKEFALLKLLDLVIRGSVQRHKSKQSFLVNFSALMSSLFIKFEFHRASEIQVRTNNELSFFHFLSFNSG